MPCRPPRQVLRAMKEGADVRGFYYWTLNDNFEWNVGGRLVAGWSRPAPLPACCLGPLMLIPRRVLPHRGLR
jgi:hypothetical protein